MGKLTWPLFDSFVLIAGPCAVESEDSVLEIADALKTIAYEIGVRLVFKASFDKANRSSHTSFRSIGFERSLKALEAVKSKYQLPVLTDVHETTHVAEVATVADILQIPAFLCRQTDLILAAAETGAVVNIKKGQFMAPEDMMYTVQKAQSTGNSKIFVTERGSSFGYHNLVVDMRGLATMREFAPVVFDATHSVQLPGGLGGSSGGKREFVPLLARAAAAAGIDGLFVETHPNPESALSDGPNMVPLSKLKNLVASVKAIHDLVQNQEAG